MNIAVGPRDRRQAAFQNIIKSINHKKHFPNQVFRGAWDQFYFCEADRVFGSGFIKALHRLLGAEHAQVACLLNFDQTADLDFEQIAAIFIDSTVTEERFSDALRAGGPAHGWLYRVDRYACASDVGDWCLYCEKGNDIAVIGLRTGRNVDKFQEALGELFSRPIEQLVQGGDAPMFPFDHLEASWHDGLIRNYRLS